MAAERSTRLSRIATATTTNGTIGFTSPNAGPSSGHSTPWRRPSKQASFLPPTRPSRPDAPKQPAPTQRASIAAQSSSTGSQPTDSRTKPGATASPQRARRSADVWTPPKEVAGWISAQPSMKRFRRRPRMPASGRSGSRSAPSARAARLCDGSSSQAGKAHAPRPPDAPVSRRAIVSADVHMRSKRTSSVSSPRCTSQASNGPGMAPDSLRQSLTAAMIVRVAAGDMAEQHVGMAVRRLGVGGDDDVGAEVERALAVGRHRRVVGDDDRAGRVGGGRDRGDVADVEAGIGRASRRRPGGSRRSRRRERSRSGAVSNGDAERLQEALRKHPRRVVAVGRQQDAVAGSSAGRRRPPRSPPCRTGRRRHGASSRCAEQLLDGIPGRIVEAAILAEAGRDRRAGGTSPPWSAAAAPDRPSRACAAQMGRRARAKGCRS